MKKILLLLILFFGLFPALHNGKLTFSSVNSVYADDFGNEDGDNNPCDPSSPAYNPSECGSSGDQCDEGSPSYNPSACEGATCTPGSPNYDPAECSAQSCDPSSVNYNASACGSNSVDSHNPCDPTSIAFNPTTCASAGEQCNESSANYNPSACEGATCAPGSPDYDEAECTAQDCDETSTGYDYTLCELGNCDPTSTNYDETECEVSTCDPDSPNYNVDECVAQVCDPTSVKYNATECEQQDCNPNSLGYDETLCDQETCDPGSPNYDAQTCAAWNSNCTSQNTGIGQSVGQFATSYILGAPGTGRFAPFTTSTSQVEQGFEVRPVNGVITDGPVQTFSSSGGSFTYHQSTIAIVHTHPINDYSAPSAADVFAMADYKAGASGFTTSYVDSYSGQFFAMVITNASALAAFVAANPGAVGSNNDWNNLTTLGGQFYDAVAGLQRDGLSLNDARTAALGMILEGSGVSLYQSTNPSTPNSFAKIGAVQIMNADGTAALDGNGNKIFIKIACPSN